MAVLFIVNMRPEKPSTDRNLGRVSEEVDQRVKTAQRSTAELSQRSTRLFHRLALLVDATLGEELISIADDFFLQALGQQVARRVNGQVLSDDLGCREASAGVTFTHPAVTEQAHRIKHLATHDAVQDVGFSAMTMDAWSIGAAHADVMQHGSLLNKLNINGSTSVNQALTQGNSQVSHLPAMRNQHPVIIITGCIVSFNNG